MYSPLHGHLRLALAPQLPQREPAFRCGKREQGAGQPPRDAGTGEPAGRAEVREAWRRPPRLLAPPLHRESRRESCSTHPSLLAERAAAAPAAPASPSRAASPSAAARGALWYTRGMATRLDARDKPSSRVLRRSALAVAPTATAARPRECDRGRRGGERRRGGARRVASRVLRGWRRDAERRTGSPPVYKSHRPRTVKPKPRLSLFSRPSPAEAVTAGGRSGDGRQEIRPGFPAGWRSLHSGLRRARTKGPNSLGLQQEAFPRQKAVRPPG